MFVKLYEIQINFKCLWSSSSKTNFDFVACLLSINLFANACIFSWKHVINMPPNEESRKKLNVSALPTFSSIVCCPVVVFLISAFYNYNNMQLYCRFSMDGPVTLFFRVHHLGLGQSTKDASDVLHKFCILTWRLFSDCYM